MQKQNVCLKCAKISVTVDQAGKKIYQHTFSFLMFQNQNVVAG